VAGLDTSQRWDRELSEDEQMALALARVVVHAPPWVVFDDTFSSLEDDTLERVIDLFTNDVPKTTIIHIGRSTQTHLPLFKRVLHLKRLNGDAGDDRECTTERILRSVP
jgi:putative ATP-binding cassette transporter